VGLYGTFSIIAPLHGGGGELSQAFCRAAAVKGSTYILSRTVKEITFSEDEYPITIHFDVTDTEDLSVAQCRTVVRPATPSMSECVRIVKRCTIVDGILDALFPQDSINCGAGLIVFPPEIVGFEEPVQVMVHGGGIGECPPNQCIMLGNGTYVRDSVLEYPVRRKRGRC
jgi:Rab proteins geranylgeranyltransferase component A